MVRTGQSPRVAHLTRVKELAYNSTFKKKTEIMASGPISPWQIEGEKVETVADFIFLGSKITDGETMETERLNFRGLQNLCGW